MLYYGQFEDNNNVTCRVEIITDGDSTSTTIIGENGLYFGGEPITIETNIDDTFQHIILKSATINLVTQDFVGNDLFANNARDIQVKIYKANECVFAGYAEPNTFSQPYVNIVDEFSINCIDALSTLQYYNYKNVKANDYGLKKNVAATATFKQILNTMFSDILSYTNGSLIYDRSKGISSSRLSYIFDDLAINELLIFGDTYDDVMTNNDLLEEILKYLNLHIVQHGENFYIFDWATIKQKTNTYWYKVFEGTQTLIRTNELTLTSDMHGDSDTSLSIADVYNQIQVKCNVEEQDTVIENPLDSGNLTSLYGGEQLYMDEIQSWHKNTFYAMIHNLPNYNTEETKSFRWFMQVMDNPNWKMYINNGQTELKTIYEKDANGVYINQDKVGRYLKQNQMIPSIIRFSKVDTTKDNYDNSVKNQKDTNDYLYISVNGNEDDTTPSPSDSVILNHSGMINYQGNSAGAFSPVDSKTTNYLVFSGRLLLQPLLYESGAEYFNKDNNYQELYNLSETDFIYVDTTYSDDEQHPTRYYTRKFYKSQYPSMTTTDYYTDKIGSLMPWADDKGRKFYEYKYTYVGNSLESVDQFTKLPILECELIIGDKRCVEVNMDEYGNSEFVWVDATSGVPQTYVDDDGNTQTYLKTTFSLGIDPKRNDYIIGEEFNLQNTISYTMNLGDAKGTAIPIRMSDNISGKVNFKILGPINLIWDDITRRHPSFWQHTKVTSTSRFILAHTQNIIIQDFECNVCTDGGGLSVLGDNDLVYCSTENDSFVNKKDDIEFKFITQLTSDEAFALGVKPTINLNSVINANTKSPQLSLYNGKTAETAKAEEHYINAYYNEYSKAKIIMETTLKENAVDWNNIYHSNPLNKDFYITSINYNIKDCNKTITLKEV